MKKTTSTKSALDLNNAIVADAARRAGLTVTSLTDGFLGISDGNSTHYSRSADFDFESLTAWLVSGNKYVSQLILAADRLPVPKCICISARELKKAFQFLESLDSAAVAKPLGSAGGRGVVTSIHTPRELTRGIAYALIYSRGRILIEQHVPGTNYRINVLDGTVISIIERMPACVTGNGDSSIRDLIETKNRALGDKSSGQIRPIVLDPRARRYLRKQGLTLASVPEVGEIVFLHEVCNADQGGEIRDVTANTDISYFELAVNAAAAVGVRLCGVDVITQDIGQPVEKSGCMINEINTTPALYVVDAPNSPARPDIGDILVKRIFSEGKPHSPG
jgi:cyanophycin synthetase